MNGDTAFKDFFKKLKGFPKFKKKKNQDVKLKMLKNIRQLKIKSTYTCTEG